MINNWTHKNIPFQYLKIVINKWRNSIMWIRVDNNPADKIFHTKSNNSSSHVTVN